ncbi:hypothetical protein PO909_005751 [Leuciscus waleckii]
MDLPVLQRLITCQNRPLVEYWWWMLPQGESLFTISMAEKEPEQESATWLITEQTQAAQSIPEPGADLICGMQIHFPPESPPWSLHLLRRSHPTAWILRSRPEIFLLQCTRLTSWSHLLCWFRLVPWIRRCYWCRPPPRLCPRRLLRAAPQFRLGLPLHQLHMRLSPRLHLGAHVSTLACQPVGFAPALRSPDFNVVRQPWDSFGSLVSPNQPQSVFALPQSRISGSPAIPRPSSPSALPGFSFPPAYPSSLLPPSSPQSVDPPSLPQSHKPAAPPRASELCGMQIHFPPVPTLESSPSPSVPSNCLDTQVPSREYESAVASTTSTPPVACSGRDVALVRLPLCSAKVSMHLGSTSVSRSPSSAWTFC